MQQKLLVYLFFFAALFYARQCRGQVAYLEIIHNCPEPALDTLDIYFNGVFYDSNFIFRTAVNLQVTSGIADTITLAYKHSTDSAGIGDGIRSFYFSPFADNQRYVLMVSGVLDTAQFAPNPDGLSTSFGITAIPVDSVSADTSQIAAKFFMGAPDLPAVAVQERLSVEQIAPLMQYNTASNDIYITHTAHELQLYNPDSLPNYGTYPINLSTFAGQVAFIFTSGFLNPAVNDSGPALILLALINGGLYAPPPEISEFQLLHNCADPAADSIDLYVNGQLAYPGLPFRYSTPAIITYAYSPFQVAIAPKNSASVTDTFWHDDFLFNRDTFYVATLSGLINPNSFAPNPDGINTDFNVLLKVPAEFSASSQQNFDFYFINGVTDAPPLSLAPQGTGVDLISNIHYDQQSNYVTVPAQFYTLQLTDSSGNTYGNYFANLPAYTGQTAVLLSSGFLNPASNQNGAAMSLYMSPIEGGPFVPLFITGIKNTAVNSIFTLFPDPASNRLFIRLNSTFSDDLSCSISDMQGKTIKSPGNFSLDDISGGLDISDLSEGCYIIQITDKNKTSYNRFIVQRK